MLVFEMKVEISASNQSNEWNESMIGWSARVAECVCKLWGWSYLRSALNNNNNNAEC